MSTEIWNAITNAIITQALGTGGFKHVFVINILTRKF
jgi:hypothetical protein